jgi:two-component system phosphate regulon sensor histidine kinase PhoR
MTHEGAASRRASALRQLAPEEERYRRVFQTAPVALLATDAFGTVVDANRAACLLLDLGPAMLVGKPLATFIDPSARRTFRSWLLAAPAGASATALRLRRRSGVAFDVAARVEPYGDELLWSLLDRSEAHQGEERLWELNRELELRVAIQSAEVEALVEQMPLGIAVVDAEARLLRVNAHARHLLPEQPAPVPEEWRASIERALRAGASSEQRSTIAGLDGTEALIEARVVPIRTGEAIVGAVVTFNDITERDRRERADREFISNAAHQIRTPITAIASAVETLQSGAKHDPEAMDRFVRHIEAAATRLAALTESLLTLSRIERGEITAPNAVVRMCPLLERLAAEADAGRVAVACADDVAAVTHEGLVQEAVASLLDNALRHTNGPVTLAAHIRAGATIIDVVDRGPGIPAHDRARVFGRFVSSGSGAGLGLAIAAAAVAAAGGRLRLADAEGGGTRARITLPSARMLT